MDKKKLILRSVSGLVYMAVIILCCMGGEIGVPILGTLLAILATVEFARMTQGETRSGACVLAVDCAMTVCLATGIFIFPLLLWMCLFICRLVMELYLKEEKPILSLGRSLMTQVYIGGPLLAMACLPGLAGALPAGGITPYGILLYQGVYVWPMLLVVFFMIWINDTGAFVVGSLFGKHRLFERISPKKSWEGFFGGWIFNLIAGTLFCYFGGRLFSMHGNLLFWLLLGSVVTVFATWGDLVESLIKRTLGLKDSGNLIPGHGGILDRIDSLLLVMPAVLVYYIVWIVGRQLL